MSETIKFAPDDSPSGGWGSVKEVATILWKEHVVFEGSHLLTLQNKANGFACVSCAWAKPANPHPFEFCESGAKATAWEITSKRVKPDFFRKLTVAELLTWSDHALEEAGRLTAPLRWDSASDTYLETDWDEAFAEIGAELRAIDAKQAVFDEQTAITLGADKGDDAQEFIEACLAMNVVPHVAQNLSGRCSAVPDAIAQTNG